MKKQTNKKRTQISRRDGPNVYNVMMANIKAMIILKLDTLVERKDFEEKESVLYLHLSKLYFSCRQQLELFKI